MTSGRRGAASAGTPVPVLRIGVTGHRRPPKLPTSSLGPVRAAVGRVLDQIFELGHAARPARRGRTARPGFRVAIVSLLAEGSDQIVAEEGLARGGTVDAVLPFPPEEYAKDFVADGTRRRFDSLLEQARSTVVLDFPRESETEAYEAAGYAMLARIDLLIAVWDEEEAGGRGGTANVVERAVEQAIPVVLINPTAPDSVTLRWAGFEPAPDAPRRFADLEPRDPSACFEAVVSARVAPQGR